jgi:hypothetical protein
MERLSTDILVVGGGTGGTAAAIQAARKGTQTILVSQFPWLGGMLTSAGVAAPDGNELLAWQTGLWGAYLKALREKQSGGLDNAWVSMFTYDPRIGAQIFAEWIEELPSLSWIEGQIPQEVWQRENKIVAVRFEDYLIEAKIVLDGTELGDILALGDIPHRWGWERRSQFKEPSDPEEPPLKYPVQAPTWVFIAQTPESLLSPQLPSSLPSPFQGAWDNYGGERFLNYGRLPGGLFMINWPICGNDYGENLNRLIGSTQAKGEFLQEAYLYSLDFANFLRESLGTSLVENIFPHERVKNSLPGINSAFALHPYYRESRRLDGLATITEWDILPLVGGRVAKLPLNGNGEIEAIAIGNYPNDHHYPGCDLSWQPKSIKWGGRWTGTPFTIPYSALLSATIDGLLVCEKNISVSHIANGSTRLQPVVMNIGQAAGMAAALCVELNCQPREVPVRKIQEALLTDPFAPAAMIPLFNLPLAHPEWLFWQRYYLDNPDAYPFDGNCSCEKINFAAPSCQRYRVTVNLDGDKEYVACLPNGKTYKLITLHPDVHEELLDLSGTPVLNVWGKINNSGGWLVVEKLER